MLNKITLESNFKKVIEEIKTEGQNKQNCKDIIPKINKIFKRHSFRGFGYVTSGGNIIENNNSQVYNISFTLDEDLFLALHYTRIEDSYILSQCAIKQVF